ncbi:g10673 [Coccomyxa viridis]|uniref:G10673 protein n=1 Tax=Coccomyxa viridis TaxID=1274662 RepID=A0ABP1GA67_9CHLO
MSPQSMMLALLSCLACLYVAGRLWSTTRELHYLKKEMRGNGQYRRTGAGFPFMDSAEQPSPGSDSVLFYSIRPSAGPATPLTGASVDDGLPIQTGDEELLGQVDGVESGEVTGWACLRGYLARPLQVVVYVDGTRVGEALASEETPHHIIHRLCELDLAVSDLQQPPQQKGVGFRMKLPSLMQGKHEIRAFVKNKEGMAQQELNQSPLPFVESASQPGLEEALKRKDAIIRVRNAQISALWDELHTRQPWTNALSGDAPINLASETAVNASRKLLVIGINTGLGARSRRDLLRKTWVPQGKLLRDLEDEKSVVIRFVVGYSEQKDDPDELRVQEEIKLYGDILRLDMVDTYADLSMKTLKMFSVLPAKFDADFYFKIDDDVAVNIDAMANYLQAKRNQGNLYLGCMKSGQVLTDRRYKWFEPEYWRFGDPASAEGQINYMRHASGQVYGLSGPVARYIGRNGPILHRFANEDVTLGAWLVGLEVTHVDERRFCCDSAERCMAQTNENNICLSYYEHQCAGICSSESRLEPIFESCLKDPLNRLAAALAEQGEDLEDQ